MDIQIIDNLIHVVQTLRVIGSVSQGDSWDVPVHNMEERLCAAEQLGELKAQTSLPALTAFLIESVMNLNWYFDAETGSNACRQMAYPSDLRRLVKSIVAIAGDDGFGMGMKQRVLPVVFDDAVNDNTFSKDYVVKNASTRLTAIFQNIGDIGGWLQQLREAINNENQVIASISLETLTPLFKEKKFYGKSIENAKSAVSGIDTAKICLIETQDVQIKTIKCEGKSTEIALTTVQNQTYNQAFDICILEIIKQGQDGDIQVSAYSDIEVKQKYRSLVPKDAAVEKLNCIKSPESGFLGIGKKQGLWRIYWVIPYMYS